MLYNGYKKREGYYRWTPAGVMFNISDLCLLLVVNYGNAPIRRANQEMMFRKTNIKRMRQFIIATVFFNIHKI